MLFGQQITFVENQSNMFFGRQIPSSVPAFLFVVPPRKKSSTQAGSQFVALFTIFANSQYSHKKKTHSAVAQNEFQLIIMTQLFNN